MEIYEIRDLTFSYPGGEEPVLEHVDLTIKSGEMVLIAGASGSGKSTLMKCMKPSIAPEGEKSGSIVFSGKDLDSADHRTEASKIGFVMQDPDSQIVTDKVWHELAFGLENLGLDTKTIRLRVAEMASFFGIDEWFREDVNRLSGGQKQILNLASVMVMQPEVLLLDEPASQLDPIAAGEFIKTVKRINSELGTTVVIAEHRLDEILPVCDRMILLDGGRITASGSPEEVGRMLGECGHPMFAAMPAPMRAYTLLKEKGIGEDLACPLDVRGGREWLSAIFEGKNIVKRVLPEERGEEDARAEVAVRMKDVWFRYDRDGRDIIKDMSLDIKRGDIHCIVGGNGSGKTTVINMIAGLLKPYRGRVEIEGRRADKHGKGVSGYGIVGVVPQDPQDIFVGKTVRLDLMEGLEDADTDDAGKERKIEETAEVMRMTGKLDMHPYDLSGGEQQRAAIAKVLLLDPGIICLDEPTKGLDAPFKAKLAGILEDLKKRGHTIIIVSHDIEFCARYADRCSMIFDGRVITENTPVRFFSGNSFYTTAANRMSRHVFDNAVLAEDIVKLVRMNLACEEGSAGGGGHPGSVRPQEDIDRQEGDGLARRMQISRNAGQQDGRKTDHVKARKRPPQGVTDISMMLLAALTVLAGVYVFDNQRYFIVSVLLVIYAMIPFFMRFERRRPRAREVVIIAVMTALAVAGRAAFFMVPNFKPILAIVIISGVSLGREAGFLIGAMSAFVSNFIFGQGPWTVWQMFAMAVIGYLAGLIFAKHAEGRIKWPLIVFGAISAFFIYGGITDIWTILVMTDTPDIAAAVMVYTAALPFNMANAAATVIFTFLLAGPVIEKLARVKKKYRLETFG